MSATRPALAAVVLLSLAPTARAEIINTIPSANTNAIVAAFSVDRVLGGQTITVGPTDTFLTDFSFVVYEALTTPFFAVVQRFDPATSSLTGPVLYLSDLQTPSAAQDYQTYTFFPNVELTAGEQYVLYLTSPAGPPVRQLYFRAVFPSAYPGGVYVAKTPVPGPIGTPTVLEVREPFDLAFSATLEPTTPVPAPASLVFWLVGVATVGFGWRPRRA
jgi:hypothetical protein